MTAPTPELLRLAEDTLAHERAAFARRVVLHLVGALLTLVLLEAVLLSIPDVQTLLVRWLLGASWRGVALLAASFALGWVAHTLGRRGDVPLLPYLGLAFSVALEAALVFPLLLLARQGDVNAPWAALPPALGLIVGLAGLALRERWTARPVIVWLGAGTLVGSAAALVFAGPSPPALILCGALGIFAILLALGLLLVVPQHDPEQPVAATQALLAVAATLVWLGLRKLWHLYLSQE